MIRFMAAFAVAFLLVALANPAEAKRHRTVNIDASGNSETYLPHPAGCPARHFCACGAAVKVFGSPIRSLWPSCAWFDGRFPRVAAAPGMVAGRCGHVFVLGSHVGGSNWMVYDYNSGGHLSRYHERSVAGLKIVNPHGGRYASR